MGRAARAVLIVGALLLSVGCGDGPASVSSTPVPPRPGPPDAGPPDAGPPDTGAPDAPPVSGGEVTLATWNLELFPKTTESAADIVAILDGLALDLIGVEEIADPAAFDAMVAAMPDHAGVVAEDYPDAFQRNGILYRTSRVTLSDVETLFQDDWYAFPRPPIKAHVTVTDVTPPFDFDFVVVHLKAYFDAESEDRRRKACIALEAWVRGRVASGGDPDVVIAGDWNDSLGDAPADNVFQVFLDAPDDYRFLTFPLIDTENGSYIPYNSLIDHIMVTSDALTEYGTGTTSVIPLDSTVPDYQANVSDHRPVVSRFILP
jgi:endonuclease/exonuclease/phosphatase family metal-dependent hydrolase